jgi:hypothetical protein
MPEPVALERRVGGDAANLAMGGATNALRVVAVGDRYPVGLRAGPAAAAIRAGIRMSLGIPRQIQVRLGAKDFRVPVLLVLPEPRLAAAPEADIDHEKGRVGVSPPARKATPNLATCR